MKVSVKREHIERAKCGAAEQCMIALAIRLADPTISYVAVRTNGITVTRRRKSGESMREHWAVPLMAARRIIAFDDNQSVEPFTFEPKLIDRVVIPARSAAQSKRDRDASKNTRARRKAAGLPDPAHRFRHRVAGL